MGTRLRWWFWRALANTVYGVGRLAQRVEEGPWLRGHYLAAWQAHMTARGYHQRDYDGAMVREGED